MAREKGVELVKVEREGDKRVEYWRQADGRVLRHIRLAANTGRMGGILSGLGKRNA